MTLQASPQGLNWFQDARFGMFIHWGLYSIIGKHEWVMHTDSISVAEYEKLVPQFNPTKFNADAWVLAAKAAGMKYIVITSKHHDGFALFDSRVSDFDVMATPFKRDIMKELSEACRRHGLKMCWYHSIMDWHNSDYLPRRDWEKDRSAEGADFLEGRLERLEEAHRLHHLRHLQLTHYRVNELGDIQTTLPVHGGLTAFGAEIIRACNRLGIVVA